MLNLTSRPFVRLLACALALPMALAACSSPETRQGTTTLLDENQPLPDEEVVVHLLEAPELPAALDGAVVTQTELRHPKLYDRHVIELVEIPAAANVKLSEMLVAGALLRVPSGASVEVAAMVEVAALQGDALSEAPTACPAPCTVTGPALVTSESWFSNWGIESGWLLVESPLADVEG